ncbi:TIGR03826 family flagellar region protein [Longirhabdus pacifica]|uniref:TIGR03826 family flagellar region protein n=1 Tax=Longirhabdus pacifica TaxID=2305227 RepID=UPI001008F801|nr:TIGR03826 family flagellar region protein [Longirhabdus pacifica]
MQLANCPRCGKLFGKGVRSICSQCVSKIEKQYDLCWEYLNEHPNATIVELSSETKVTISQIEQFITEGRLSIRDNPNMGYPCDMCGGIIRGGKVCKDCSDRLKTEVKNLFRGVPGSENQHTDKNGKYNIGDRLVRRGYRKD